MSRKGARIARGRAGRTDGAIIVDGHPKRLKTSFSTRVHAMNAIREDKKRTRHVHRLTRDEIDIDSVLSGS